MQLFIRYHLKWSPFNSKSGIMGYGLGFLIIIIAIVAVGPRKILTSKFPKQSLPKSGIPWFVISWSKFYTSRSSGHSSMLIFGTFARWSVTSAWTDWKWLENIYYLCLMKLSKGNLISKSTSNLDINVFPAKI